MPKNISDAEATRQSEELVQKVSTLFYQREMIVVIETLVRILVGILKAHYPPDQWKHGADRFRDWVMVGLDDETELPSESLTMTREDQCMAIDKLLVAFEPQVRFEIVLLLMTGRFRETPPEHREEVRQFAVKFLSEPMAKLVPCD